MRLQFPEAGLSLPRANSSSSSSPNAHGPRQCTRGSRGRRLGLRPSAVCCGPPQTAPVGTVHSPSLSPVSQTRPLPGGPTRPLQAAATGTAWDRRCWHLSKTPSAITPESRPPAPCEPGRDSSSVAGGWGGHALQTQCGVPRNNGKSLRACRNRCSRGRGRHRPSSGLRQHGFASHASLPDVCVHVCAHERSGALRARPCILRVSAGERLFLGVTCSGAVVCAWPALTFVHSRACCARVYTCVGMCVREPTLERAEGLDGQHPPPHSREAAAEPAGGRRRHLLLAERNDALWTRGGAAGGPPCPLPARPTAPGAWNRRRSPWDYRKPGLLFSP